ncbi:MAG: dephospho-CoA kinase [Burkholderiales bacterium]|jgi:dephospho-CoA kinase|nr:dephospho-CoA kinase [Burkholderiales bacterium]
MTKICTPLRLGLTGGIGSGKSTVAGMLAARGGAVIDSDAIARSVTAANGSAIAAISQSFGAEFLTPDGALDRERMRALVFSDLSAKLRLEAIVHPLVAMATQAQAQQAILSGHTLLIFDVPLLVESSRWRKLVDQVLVIDCLENTQIDRTMVRSGLTREAVQNIIRAQATRTQRLAAADITLFNEGLDLEQLRLTVDALALNV